MMLLDRDLCETAGLTRSQAGKAVRAGRVTVNAIAVRKPDQKLDEQADRVTLDGSVCVYRRHRYYLLDKPTGVLTATEDRTQPTVLDLFPAEIRRQGLFPVGRLDKDTSGLLLLTDDGDFAHRVISPKSGIKKVYLAQVEGKLTQDDVCAFANGLVLRDGLRCLPAELEIINPSLARITVQEGKYHQVRRMLAACGKTVLTLRRISIGGLCLDSDTKAGHFRELTENDLCILFNGSLLEK